jgi:serine/threonine protein kinase
VANGKSKDEGPAARVGITIKGKWKVESLLGVGGMAAVYAASHRNGQKAALKILHQDFAREKTICDRFLREAYVSNKVNHAATVQVLDDDMTEQGEPFLIMELLLGETVRDAWKKCGRTMPVGRVLQISERVVDCLASCHAINVIHRDLKPANIFITEENEIKVLDFGVAQMRDATSERTATGTALGTPAYMSPEQAMGLVDQLDGRADLFSVGAMMHALITGHRINNGRTEQEALVMAATKPVPSVARIAPQLPIELIKAVDKSLAWDRRNRYQDSREMQKALLELMRGQNTLPLPAKPPPRPEEVVAPPPPPISDEMQAQVQGQVAGGAAPAAHAAPAPAPAPPPPAPVPQAPPQQAMPQHAPMPPQQQQQQQVGNRKMTNPSLGGMPAPQVAAQQAPQFDPLLGYTPALEAPQPQIQQQQQPQPWQQPQQGPQSQLVPTAQAEVPENDPRVQALRDLMKHWDRLFPSIRQLGATHPATERTLRLCYDAFAEALRQTPTLVSWTVRPYSLMSLGHTVWEPGAPFDEIPYNLFACGVRSIRLDAGVSLDEMRDLFGLLLLNPARDLPPEDDLAAALWERALPHVKYECADAFAEGDAAEREAFYADADAVEKLAEEAAKNQTSDIESRAMALSTDDAALRAMKDASPFALDDQMRIALAPQLDMSREMWAERYVDALVEGYLDSAANRDAPLVLASLRKSAQDFVVAGKMSTAVQISQAVIERLRHRVQGPENQMKLASALTHAMFGAETLELVLKKLKEDPSALEMMLGILGALGPSEFPTMLANFRDAQNLQIRGVLAQWLERYVHGHEQDIGAAAQGADPDCGAMLLQMLARAGTPAARQVITQLGQSEDVNVRVEARVLSAPNADQVQNELSAMLDNQSPFVRMAALRTLTRYGMRNAWPTVARVIGGKGFNELGNDERRELLRAAIVLSPDRGEPLALDLAKKGGVLMSENREYTRTLACELLGELSRSRNVAQSLNELTQGRWGISEETRIAASNAAKRIVQRIEQQAGPQGGSFRGGAMT